MQENEVHYNKIVDPYNGHAYVEIGGLKWATMNIGASSVTDYGKYFQWADISGYTVSQVGTDKVFNWANYKYGNGTSSPGSTGITKYNKTDGKTVLEAVDDAAQANWGGSWRMPTAAEFEALGNAVNTAWTVNYQGSGVSGVVCTDKTDSSKVLFFPAGGAGGNSRVIDIGLSGYYWSSSLYGSSVDAASQLDVSAGSVVWSEDSDRITGQLVRGVVG
jgi:uncharacterized protein (TIGR02145 family)